MLSGHTDVVPVDGQSWSKNPFKIRFLFIVIWLNSFYDYALDGGNDCTWTWKSSDDSCVHTMGYVGTYKDERKTEITASQHDLTVEDLITEEEMVVTLSNTGYIKSGNYILF